MRFGSQLIVFFLSFLTFAWFHQGGGWNQNARFAEVRALVEEGRFAIDDFLVYRANADAAAAAASVTHTWELPLARETVKDGEFSRDGNIYRLCWGGTNGAPLRPANGRALSDGALPALIGNETCSGDIGYAPTGHFYSNKPPGTSLLAAPVYFVLFHFEQACGLNADSPRVLNINQWLCSVFTVGLASALGVILVWRVGARIFPEHPRAALAAGFTFAFGTTFFPFGTMLFDHNLTAVLLFASFAAIRRERPALAGLCAGVAAVTNYLAGLPGMVFGLWAFYRSLRAAKFGDVGVISPAGTALRFLGGVAPCLAVLLTYNAIALGSPFALNTSFQNPQFQESSGAFLGMFTLPSWFAAQALTISPWRGLFVLSPILLFALPPLFRWPRHRRPEKRIIVFMMGFFFLVNICFNGFHGGEASGPRYLIPLLPFLCLGLIPAFVRFPRLSILFATVSIAQQTLLTATDAMSPVGVSDRAWQDHPGEWKEKLYGNSLITRYAWPLFSEGRAEPIIRAEFEEWEKNNPGRSTEEKARAASRLDRGIPDPVPLAAMPGPVSVNVVSGFEGGVFQLTEPHSKEATWASFNAGEFLGFQQFDRDDKKIEGFKSWTQSRWSLVPLILLWIYGGLALQRKGLTRQEP